MFRRHSLKSIKKVPDELEVFLVSGPPSTREEDDPINLRAAKARPTLEEDGNPGNRKSSVATSSRLCVISGREDVSIRNTPPSHPAPQPEKAGPFPRQLSVKTGIFSEEQRRPSFQRHAENTLEEDGSIKSFRAWLSSSSRGRAFQLFRGDSMKNVDTATTTTNNNICCKEDTDDNNSRRSSRLQMERLRSFRSWRQPQKNDLGSSDVQDEVSVCSEPGERRTLFASKSGRRNSTGRIFNSFRNMDDIVFSPGDGRGSATNELPHSIVNSTTGSEAAISTKKKPTLFRRLLRNRRSRRQEKSQNESTDSRGNSDFNVETATNFPDESSSSDFSMRDSSATNEYEEEDDALVDLMLQNRPVQVTGYANTTATTADIKVHGNDVSYSRWSPIPMDHQDMTPPPVPRRVRSAEYSEAENSRVSAETCSYEHSSNKEFSSESTNGDDESKSEEGDGSASVITVQSIFVSPSALDQGVHSPLFPRNASIDANRTEDEDYTPKSCLKKQEGAGLYCACPSDRNVTFTVVQIREYERTVGDNPSCTNGPPIGLGWAYHDDTPHLSVEDHTLLPKRTKRQFHLPAARRNSLLVQEWCVSEEKIREALRETTFIQYCREKSNAASTSSSARKAPSGFEYPVPPTKPEISSPIRFRRRTSTDMISPQWRSRFSPTTTQARMALNIKMPPLPGSATRFDSGDLPSVCRSRHRENLLAVLRQHQKLFQAMVLLRNQDLNVLVPKHSLENTRHRSIDNQSCYSRLRYSGYEYVD